MTTPSDRPEDTAVLFMRHSPLPGPSKIGTRRSIVTSRARDAAAMYETLRRALENLNRANSLANNVATALSEHAIDSQHYVDRAIAAELWHRANAVRIHCEENWDILDRTSLSEFERAAAASVLR